MFNQSVSKVQANPRLLATSPRVGSPGFGSHRSRSALLVPGGLGGLTSPSLGWGGQDSRLCIPGHAQRRTCPSVRTEPRGLSRAGTLPSRAHGARAVLPAARSRTPTEATLRLSLSPRDPRVRCFEPPREAALSPLPPAQEGRGRAPSRPGKPSSGAGVGPAVPQTAPHRACTHRAAPPAALCPGWVSGGFYCLCFPGGPGAPADTAFHHHQSRKH